MTEVPPPAWAAMLAEWHAPMAYALAFVFPVWRWIRRRWAGFTMNLGIIIHQAALGFIMPAFLMLLMSYGHHGLVQSVSPHELGMAGLVAALTTLRELFVDGRSDEQNNSRF